MSEAHVKRKRCRALRRLLAHRAGVVGAVLVAAVVLAGALAPLLTPYQPDQIRMEDALEPPSRAHPMGTDVFGRDVLTRLLYGARFSLEVSVLSRLIAIAIGTFLGLVAGYFGGRLESAVMRLAVIMITVSIPTRTRGGKASTNP